VLPLADTVLIVEATGNRPDLASIYGIAREVATIYDLPLAELPGSVPVTPAPERGLAIAIEDLAGCPRYVGRLFEGVAVAPSPQWLRIRLQAAGMRPISNVVDVTNYVMLALGSPLHASTSPLWPGGGSSSAGRPRPSGCARSTAPSARSCPTTW
jgi:phenylalanyl-tRNA synthetase beta chain